MSAVLIRVLALFPAGSTGQVVITPTLERLDPAGPVFPAEPVVCTIDPSGHLLGPDGQLGVQLIADDSPDLEPVGSRHYVEIGIDGAEPEQGYIFVPAAAPSGQAELSALLAAS